MLLIKSNPVNTRPFNAADPSTKRDGPSVVASPRGFVDDSGALTSSHAE